VHCISYSDRCGLLVVVVALVCHMHGRLHLQKSLHFVLIAPAALGARTLLYLSNATHGRKDSGLK
jgi:hypothetical protein